MFFELVGMVWIDATGELTVHLTQVCYNSENGTDQTSRNALSHPLI